MIRLHCCPAVFALVELGRPYPDRLPAGALVRLAFRSGGRLTPLPAPFPGCRQSWRRRPASSRTTMKATAAIRAVMMNVLSVAENQPMAVKMSHMPRIAPGLSLLSGPCAYNTHPASCGPWSCRPGSPSRLLAAHAASAGARHESDHRAGRLSERFPASTETVVRSWNRPVSADMYPFNGISGHAINCS